jgi:hypothetical protein
LIVASLIFILTFIVQVGKAMSSNETAEGEHPNDIRESDYFTEKGEFRVDAEGSPTLLNCLVC